MKKDGNDLLFTLGNLKDRIKKKIEEVTQQEQIDIEEKNKYLSSISTSVDSNINLRKSSTDIILEESTDAISDVEPLAEAIQVNKNNSEKASKLLSKEKIKNLKGNLLSKVYGQDFVIEEVVDVLKVALLNIKINKDKPAGNYLFAGPSGVGKTELAQCLAQSLDVPMLVVNMGEYGLEQDVTKLIGTSPGYVGYNDGGILTNFIMENPYSIVLFDEIEKAHPSADKILLSIMDKGTATDNKGNIVLFKNTIIISTTNLGADIEYVTDISKEDKDKYRMDSIKEGLRPEIINRYDSIFQFNSLSPEVYKMIVDKFVNLLVDSLHLEHEIKLKLTDKAKNFIVNKSFDPSMGGRPARRFIEKIIIKPLADYLIETDESSISTTITIDINKQNNVCFKGKSNKVLGVLENTAELVNKIESTKFTN